MFEKYQEQTSLKKTRIKKVYGIFVKCFHMITKLKSQELWSQMMSYSYFLRVNSRQRSEAWTATLWIDFARNSFGFMTNFLGCPKFIIMGPKSATCYYEFPRNFMFIFEDWFQNIHHNFLPAMAKSYNRM